MASNCARRKRMQKEGIWIFDPLLLLKPRDIVKKIMKNQPANQRKTNTSLPLEGGGNRVGVKELRAGVRALRKVFRDSEIFRNIEGI